MNPVFVPLAEGPFLLFKSGRKTWEIRNAEGNPVAAQVRKRSYGDPVLLRRGYGRCKTGPFAGTFVQINRRLGRTWEGPARQMPEIVKQGACLTEASWDGRYFNPNGRVLCFEALEARTMPARFAVDGEMRLTGLTVGDYGCLAHPDS